MKYLFCVSFLSIIFLSSCGARKLKTQRPEEKIQVPLSMKKEMDTAKVSNAIDMLLSEYGNWLNGVRSIRYKMDGKVFASANPIIKNIAIKTDLHLLKDSIIWGSVQSSLFGIEILKFIFYKDSAFINSSVAGINNQTKTYEELTALSKVDLSFEKIQEFFLYPLSIEKNAIKTYELSAEDSSKLNVYLYPDSAGRVIKKEKVALRYDGNKHVFPISFDLRYSDISKNDTLNYLHVSEEFVEGGDRQLEKIIFHSEAFQNAALMISITLKTSSIETNAKFEMPE